MNNIEECYWFKISYFSTKLFKN